MTSSQFLSWKSLHPACNCSMVELRLYLCYTSRMKDLEPRERISFPKEINELINTLKHGIPEKGIDPDMAATLYATEARKVELESCDGGLDLRYFIDNDVSQSQVVLDESKKTILVIKEAIGENYELDAGLVLAGLWSQRVHASNAPEAINLDTRKRLKAIPYYDRDEPYTIELAMSYYSAVMLARKLEPKLNVDFWRGK
jgi:hypothetical protein